MTAKTPGINARQVERIAVALESIARSLKCIESSIDNYGQLRVAAKVELRESPEPVVGIWLTKGAVEDLRRIF